MTGYTRQSLADIQDGEDIVAGPLNDEFDQIQAAFNGVTGHAHDGTTGNGPLIELDNAVNGILPVANGGTGSDTASGARTNLGLVIGTNVQAYDAGLQSISGLTTAADTMIYTTALDVYATTALTPFARTVLDDTTAGAALTTLGVSAFAQTLLDDAAASNARTTLGLGTSATVNTGTSGATIPLLNGVNTWSGNQTISNSAPNLSITDTDTGATALLSGSSAIGNFNILVDNTSATADPAMNVSVKGTQIATINGNGVLLGSGKSFELAGSGGLYWNSADGAINYATGDFTFFSGNAAGSGVVSDRLRLNSATDVSLSSTNHAFQIGASSGLNLAIDSNEIMARNNGATNTLVLNADGGNITLGHSSATVTINGTLAGLAVGSSVQAWDADLDTLATNSSASAGNFLVYRRNDAGTLSTATASSTGFSVLGGNASSIRTTLGIDTNDDVVFGSVASTASPSISGNTDQFNFAPGANSHINRDANVCFSLNRFTSTGTIQQFRNDGTVVGSVSVTGAATAYNTSSDVRLKHDFQPINPALLDQINVYDFAWNYDNSRAYGVKAQELCEIIPQAVHKGDDPENDMWSVDYSKLVPLLIAKVQDLEARLKVLEGN